MLTLGADVHAVGATRDVGSALHVAATAGDHATAEVLLAARASPFLVHHGATPLDAAAAAGDVHMCRRLESLSLFAGWVYERRPPGLIDSALGRERWERRYLCVAPRYSAPTPPSTDVLCALQLRIMRRDVDAAPIEMYFLHAARLVPAASGPTLEVFVPDLLAIQHTPNAQRIITFSCTPPGVFPPEGGSAAAAAQRLNALLAACTSRAPPRVPMPRRSPAAPGVNVASFPSPPPSTGGGGEMAPAVQLAWLGTQPAPRSIRSGAPETERSWPAALQLRVSMPLLTRASDVTVAVTGQELNLHAPGKYRLRAALPYPIAADVAAVFDTERHELNLSCTVLCIPRDPPQQPAQQAQAGPSVTVAPPPPLPPRPARAQERASDADFEEAIRRSLADVAVPPPPPPPGAVPPPSAPPLPTAAPAAAAAPPSAPPSVPPASTASADDEASLCIICMTDKRTVGLLHGSSMHVVACAGCAPHLRAKPCPMCRAPVERLVENIYS